MTSDVQAARERAVSYIGISRHRTSGKIKEKLVRDGFDTDVIDDVLTYLQSIDYLDDGRAAKHILSQYRGRKGRSRAMLSALLLSRGVPPDVARSVIDELDPDEALARSLIDATFPRGADREAIYKRLISRGFHPNLAATVSRLMASETDYD